jgi:thioredoxin reductase (NADPH)
MIPRAIAVLSCAREGARVAGVTIYTTRWCNHCARAKVLLERKGARFVEIDVETDATRKQEMVERSGGRRTVPQIFVGGEHVGGADDLYALERDGRLDRLLERARRQDDVKTHEVVIVGSGPAGLTAAIYAARASLAPVVVEGLAAGGQLMTTTDVENYPGFPDGVQGPAMIELFKKQAERFGATFVAGDVRAVDFGRRPLLVATDEGELHARAVIVATGASARQLGIPGEAEYAGRGVSYCATCDGFFFRGQEIVVVGGGDTAMEEALFLTRFGSRVTVVHRREQLRASKIMADRALAHEKIEFVWNSEVTEVRGDGTKVQAIRVRNVVTGDETERPCGGFFVAIGHVPNTELFRGILPMDEQGYLVVGASSATPIPGVFVAGDVHDHVYRQAVTAAGAGCRAAIDCERWLEAEKA